MPSQLWVPGPVQLSVGTGASGALEQLGFTEDAVRVTSNAAFRDVNVDIAGSEAPFDVQWMGETENVVRANLARFDATVWNKVQQYLSAVAFTGSGTAGSGLTNQIGTLMVAEGATIRLLVRSLYSGKTIFSGNTTFLRNYPAAYLAGPYELAQSTRNQVIPIVFRAIPVFAADGSYTLWNTTTTGQPSVS